jgi:hypothetical protein
MNIIGFNGTLTYDATKPGNVLPNLEVQIGDDVPLVADTFISLLSWIHLDTVGEYELCFWAECEAAPCFPDVPDPLVEVCFELVAHQWKDAAKIELWEKWNLISLPLVPFDTDICSMLSSVDTTNYLALLGSGIPGVNNLFSVWYYDAAAEDWLVFGNGQDSLTTIESGKAYWIRLNYPLYAQWIQPYNPPYGPPDACGNYSWWVFGTEKPEPPSSPEVYSVEEGWNMVGFTCMNATLPCTTYLENWVSGVGGPEPVIYGWTQGCFAAQGWNFVDFDTDDLESGQGYWMSFPSAGSVYQFVP